MSRMRLKYDEDYFFNVTGNELFLWVANVYDKFTRYHKDHAIKGEVLTKEQFISQLKESGYCLNEKKSKQIRMDSDTNRRYWKIDYEKLCQNAEVEGFKINWSGDKDAQAKQ